METNDSQAQIKEMGEFIISLAPAIIKSLNDGFWEIAHAGIGEENGDVVTVLDHRIGGDLKNAILGQFPEVTIDSEEAEERHAGGDVVVRIDPLDGTKNAIRGIDIISTTISVSINGSTQFGMVVNPFSQKIYHAFATEGAYLNNNKIVVGDGILADSYVFVEEPYKKLHQQSPEVFERFANLHRQLMANSYRVRNIGNGSLSICYVAEDAACAYVDLTATTKLYDIEAALLIAKEAGAMIGTIDGEIITDPTVGLDDKKTLTQNIIVANTQAFKEIGQIQH